MSKIDIDIKDIIPSKNRSPRIYRNNSDTGHVKKLYEILSEMIEAWK